MSTYEEQHMWTVYKQIEESKIKVVWLHFEKGKQLRRKKDDCNERIKQKETWKTKKKIHRCN